MNKYEVVYPLDAIQFVSGNKKLYLFMAFLFERATKFNKEMKVEEGEGYFPIASYNERAYAYDFEFEFFVESYVEYAKEYYDIDENSQSNLYQYLYYSTDTKIKKARFIFFVNTLGGYYGLGSGYYSDPIKNKGLIFYEKYVKNEHGFIANSRAIQVRNFMDKHLDENLFKSLKGEKLEQVAYGKVQMEKYNNENDIGEIPKIYDLEEI